MLDPECLAMPTAWGSAAVEAGEKSVATKIRFKRIRLTERRNCLVKNQSQQRYGSRGFDSPSEGIAEILLPLFRLRNNRPLFTEVSVANRCLIWQATASKSMPVQASRFVIGFVKFFP